MLRTGLFMALVCCSRLVWGQATDQVGHTRSIRLSERAGVERVQMPVEVTVRFERESFRDAAAVRLFRSEGGNRTAVPCQVLDVISHEATDSFAPKPQTFVRLVFPADVPARGKAAYEVSLEGPPPAPPRPLQVTGQFPGRTIDAAEAVFELHKPSGQLVSFTPKSVNNDRLVFLQHEERGELPFHWNPDVWPTGGRWGHTSSWNAPVAFDPAQHKADAPPAGDDMQHPYYYREWDGPLVYRQTRWGRMPFVPAVDVSVTYSFYAGTPFVLVESLMEFREDLAVHAVRNAELVFSRHQFDTAAWIDKEGRLHTAAAYDYDDPDKSFQNIADLPPDTPALALANERKGYGIAYLTLGLTHQNRHLGHADDEGAHFYIRDYDEHGKGSPANFLYFVRPIVYREGYLPTTVRARSLYAERGVVVVFKLNPDENARYDELVRWQKVFANPLEIAVD